MLAAIALSHHHHNHGGLSAFNLGVIVYGSIAYVGFVVGLWGIFRKAGWHGWEAIIPVWNLYGYCRVCRGTGWFVILLLIPFINLIAGLVVIYDLARSFGRRWAWWWALWLLPFVFYPILGFSSIEYLGPAGDPSARDAFGKITRR